MRVFAISDIHADYMENRRWLEGLSRYEYKKDILILAGDVTDDISLFARVMEGLKLRFGEIAFVPGNHDLWVRRYVSMDSRQKYQAVKDTVSGLGIRSRPFEAGGLCIVPLLGWYDYSFGQPSKELWDMWVDYTACVWPDGWGAKDVCLYFTAINEGFIRECSGKRKGDVISFSHFLPRIDLMPSYIPPDKRKLFPILGSTMLEGQIRRLGSAVHVYGHSHVNTRAYMDKTLYINNAFGYPNETFITRKELVCIYGD